MPYRKFQYRLKDEQGNFINEIKSNEKIKSNDNLAYKGSHLIVVKKDGENLFVKKIGDIIEIK